MLAAALEQSKTEGQDAALESFVSRIRKTRAAIRKDITLKASAVRSISEVDLPRSREAVMKRTAGRIHRPWSTRRMRP